MKKVLGVIVEIGLHLLVLGILAWLFRPLLEQAIQTPKLPGWDSDQFIFKAYDQARGFVWPPGGWDNLWFEGVPRVLNMTFIHFYLIQPLVGYLGLNLATVIYPLIWLLVYFFFAYLLFYRLAKSRVLALALTLILMYSQSTYMPIYIAGVVLSGLAQMVMPAILFFLVVFVQTGERKYLILAALVLAFQFYSHGAMGLFFGLISSGILLGLCRFRGEKLFSAKIFEQIMGFGLMTLSMGILAIGPQVLSALSGGYYSNAAVVGSNLAEPHIFSMLVKATHPGLFLVLGIALVLGLVFYKRLRSRSMVFALGAMLLYILGFFLMKMLGGNNLGDYLFTGRIFWYFALIGAALSASLLSVLSGESKGWLGNIVKIVVGGAIVGLVWQMPMDTTEMLPGQAEILDNKLAQDERLFDTYKTSLKGTWEEVDHQDTNYRAWLQAPEKMFWNTVSDVPLVQGYFHFHTEHSDDWVAWLFATLSEETVENKTISQAMGDKQARFLLDWYGVKYLVVYPGPEFNVAPRIWQENDYILKKSHDLPPAVLTLREEAISKIVEAVAVPVVGFVGDSEGYDAFLRDLGMLNLNTHYLIPLRLGESVNQLSKRDLDKLDMVVVYNFKGKGRGWKRLEDYVTHGGKLFIETAGSSIFRQGVNLPLVFPVASLEYETLGNDWQVKTYGGMTRVDFDQLGSLIYEGDEAWKMSFVPDDRFVRDGAKVWLTQKGKPVMAEMSLGEGRVIWSGVNSLYRPWKLKDSGLEEVKVFETILNDLLLINHRSDVGIKIDRQRTEKIVVRGGDFSSLVLKENKMPGWKAWVEVGGRKERLKIYGAGPDLMAVLIPDEYKSELMRVVYEYKGPWYDWLFLVVAIVSIVLAMIEVVTGGWITSQMDTTTVGREFNIRRQGEKIKKWWNREDE